MGGPDIVMGRAVFLDRDGTLIPDVGYPASASEVELLPGVGAALSALHADGWRLVVVSNQSGIGRGLLTRRQAAEVHRELCRQLDLVAVRLDGAYYCPHAPGQACRCRKPAPGLFSEAADELGIALAQSVVVGDRISDLEAGRTAGCGAGILLGDSETPPHDGFNFHARCWDDVPRLVRLATEVVPR